MRTAALILLSLTAVATILVSATGTVGASRPSSTAASGSATVYKITVEATEGRGRYGWTQWVDTRTGAWRMEDGSRIRIYDGYRTHATVDHGLAEVRRGSRRFLGHLARAPFDMARFARDLRRPRSTRSLAQKRFQRRHGNVQMTGVVVDTLTSGQAKAHRLFALPSRWTSLALERPVGAAPTNGVRAYWLGRSTETHVAVTSLDHSNRITLEQRLAGMERKAGRLHYVFYEREGKVARNALATQGAIRGDIQVVSQPLDEPLAAGAIAAFNGVNGELRYEPWPRFAVKLRNGEVVTVVPHRGDPVAPDASGQQRFTAFSVITRTSLVSVQAVRTEAEIRSLASQLIPIGS